MYTVFTNRAYILNFLDKNNKIENIYCEENSYAEIFCKKNNLNYTKYTNKKNSLRMLNKLVGKKIILNGYKFIIPRRILIKLKYKLINIHPSLLPLYPGQFVVKKMIKDRPKYIGATVHWVSEVVDAGLIITQSKRRFETKAKIKDFYKMLFELELVAFKKFFTLKVF